MMQTEALHGELLRNRPSAGGRRWRLESPPHPAPLPWGEGVPAPGAGEVLVKTAAIGLNFADLFVRAGAYPRTPKPPFVPGMEISGTVEAVGEGVADLHPGQRVVAVPLFGGHAEKVAVPAAWVFPLPDGVDLVEAAAMPIA